MLGYQLRSGEANWRPAASVTGLHQNVAEIQILRAVQECAFAEMHIGSVVLENLPGSLLRSTKVSSDRQFIASCSLALPPVRLARKVSLATQPVSFPPSWWVARPHPKMESPRHFSNLLDCWQLQITDCLTKAKMHHMRRQIKLKMYMLCR